MALSRAGVLLLAVVCSAPAWAAKKSSPPPASVPMPPPPVLAKREAPAAAVAADPPPRVEQRSSSPPPPENGKRLGVGADFFGESSRLVAEQWINQFRGDESFDYSSGTFFSGTAWLLFPVSSHLRFGPGLRVLGNYSSAGRQDFSFGLLTEGFGQAELSFRTFERFELVISGRAGLAVLVPTTGSDFGREIDRLQAQGVGVFPGPRLGWLAGLSVGMRRKMTDWFHLRADLLGQHEELYLFATDQTISGLRVQKWWRTSGWRFGLNLGAELAL